MFADDQSPAAMYTSYVPAKTLFEKNFGQQYLYNSRIYREGLQPIVWNHELEKLVVEAPFLVGRVNYSGAQRDILR